MLSVIRLAKDVATKLGPSIAARCQQARRWLETPRKPLTWTELRGKLTTLSLPSTNGGRLVLAAGIVVLLLLLLLVVLPWYARPQIGEKGVATYPQATLLNPIFTVAAAVAAGGFALMRHFQTIAAERQRRITETFSKAVEHLSGDKVEQRLGGIYTLERLASEALASPSEEGRELYWTVMETLTGFVRERAKWQKAAAAGGGTGKSDYVWGADVQSEAAAPNSAPATDIAAVLAVITRRPKAGRDLEKKKRWRFDLRATDLRGAFLNGVHLERADLRGAHLEGAILVEAHLEGATLWFAHLDRAILSSAILNGADLNVAHLEGARLFGATGLIQAQIVGAFGNAETRLPGRLTPPAHWSQSLDEQAAHIGRWQVSDAVWGWLQRS
jgi:hypothetical protein